MNSLRGSTLQGFFDTCVLLWYDNFMCRYELCEKEDGGSKYLCKSHRMQMYRKGKLSPLRTVGDPIKRFWEKVDISGEHWLWIPGPRDEHGYGQFSIGTKKLYPHRFSYQIHKGNIPADLEIDHICRIKLCVMPSHLRAVTRKTNANNRNDNLVVIGGVLYCTKSHAIIGDNEYIRPNGRRECRVCINRLGSKAHQDTKNRIGSEAS